MVGARQSWLVEAVAAALLACACAFATAVVLFGAGAGRVLAAAVAVGAGSLAFAAAFGWLRRFSDASDMALAAFALAAMPEPAHLEELQLTDDMRFKPASEDESDGELLLGDVLAELRPSARVIQLFDPASMPTPGELQARIDRHLHSSDSRPAPPDASEALHQALADLRRSLR